MGLGSKLEVAAAWQREGMTTLPMVAGADLKDFHKRARLEHRIRRKYHLRWISFEAGGREFQIAKVADPNTVFHEAMYDEARQQDAPLAWQPYWAEAWDSSVVLAQVVAELELNQRRLMDLGCGVGVVGAVAAGLGAQVVLGDIALPGLLFSQLNVWPWRHRATVRRIDWDHDRLQARFDCIACADVVYDRKNWEPLDRFWRHHLAPGGEVLVTEPNRFTGREFRSAIVERGWVLDTSLGVRGCGDHDIVVSRLRPR